MNTENFIGSCFLVAFQQDAWIADNALKNAIETHTLLMDTTPQ